MNTKSFDSKKLAETSFQLENWLINQRWGIDSFDLLESNCTVKPTINAIFFVTPTNCLFICKNWPMFIKVISKVFSNFIRHFGQLGKGFPLLLVQLKTVQNYSEFLIKVNNNQPWVVGYHHQFWGPLGSVWLNNVPVSLANKKHAFHGQQTSNIPLFEKLSCLAHRWSVGTKRKKRIKSIEKATRNEDNL